MMLILGTVARILLAGMWLTASASKAGSLDSMARTVESLSPLRGLAARVFAFCLLLVEATTGVLFIPSATVQVASCMSIALLVSFSVAVAISLVKGIRVRCNCFGQIGDKPISKRTLARNIGLTFLSGFSLMSTLPIFGDAAAAVQQPDWALSFILAASIALTLWLISSIVDLAERILLADDGPSEHLPEVRWLRRTLNKQA